MSETELVNHIGILHEPTNAVGTDAINPASTTHYLLGKATEPMGDYPNEELKFQPMYFNSYETGEILRTSSKVVGDPLLFEPVNCYPWKFLFCSGSTGISTDAGSPDLFTIDPITSGQRSSFTKRTDAGNSSINDRDHYLGNRLFDYSEVFDFFDPTGEPRLQSSWNDEGLRRVDPESDVSNPPIYPNSTSNSYKKDDNTVLTWDDDSMLPEIGSFRWGVQLGTKDHPIDNQLYPEAYTTGNMLVNFSFTIRRAGGTSTSIRTDHKALVSSGTTKDIHFKIHNTATLYKDVVLNDCVWNMKRNHVIDNLMRMPTWIVTGIAKTITPTFKDGLDKTTFYEL